MCNLIEHCSDSYNLIVQSDSSKYFKATESVWFLMVILLTIIIINLLSTRLNYYEIELKMMRIKF